MIGLFERECVLVTGGAGFIGSQLCERLLKLGYRVVCLDCFDRYYSQTIKRRNISGAEANPRYTLVEADIRDEEALEAVFCTFEPKLVIHLAALAGVRNSIQRPQEYMDVDVTGTVNMLEAARRHEVKRFLFASSSSVYGDLPVPYCEGLPLGRPLSPYAAAKQMGEQLCWVYHWLHGLSVVCLRFFTVYGERQRPEMAVHKLTRLIREGQEVTLYGNGESMRDYTYVGDVLDGIVAAMELVCGFEAINLGTGRGISLLELVHLLEVKLGRPAKIKWMDQQKGDAESTLASLEKAKKLLGYEPHMEFKEGLDRFLVWYEFEGRY